MCTWSVSSMESFAEIYRDACLIDLKYKHLVEVCESLLHPWNSRDVKGKLVKKEIKSEDTLQTDGSAPMSASVVLESTSKDFADLQLLDSILNKAQRVREGEDIPKPKKTTTSMAMASQVYGQPKPHPKKTTHKPPPKKTPHKPASGSSRLKTKQSPSSKTQTLDSGPPLVVNHKTRSAKSIAPVAHRHTASVPKSESENVARVKSLMHCKKAEGGSESTLEMGRGDEVAPGDGREGKSECFQLHTSGQRLSMPSRYTKLQKLLSRLNAQYAEVAKQPTCSQGADHFSKRLLSETSAEQAAMTHLLVVLEEYVLIKQELQTLTPKEWAVSDKSQWQEVLRVKSKLDSILSRIQELHNPTRQGSKETEESPSQATSCPCLPSFVHHPSRQLAYTELEQLKDLATLEHQLLLETWEAELVGFVEKTVLSFVMTAKGPFCDLLRCTFTLFCVGSRDSLPVRPSYLLVEPQ